MKTLKKLIQIILISVLSLPTLAQNIPSLYTNIHYDPTAKNYYFKNPTDNKAYYADTAHAALVIQNFNHLPIAYDSGFVLNFVPTQTGSVLYGLQDAQNELQHVVYYRNAFPLVKGKMKINLLGKLSGNYDFINWETKERGKVGYRVFSTTQQIIFDGSFVFTCRNHHFALDTCLSEGPYIANLTNKEVTIWFETNMPIAPQITIPVIGGEKTFFGTMGTHHEIALDLLRANTEYKYTITLGDYAETFSFTTAPDPGTQNPFMFAYASDCRAGQGGNERNIMGVNSYVMSRIASLALNEKASFVQITGDLMSGYDIDENKMNLEYRNFRNAISPYAARIPFYMGMGNHEAIAYQFGGSYQFAVDKFPFDTNSQEKIFADNFVNPTNGPPSEDDAAYDTNKEAKDFPPYGENVYYYTYGNTAMIVLNTEYLYTQSEKNIPLLGGNVHAYIMDNQMKWLAKTLNKLEQDVGIDHIFVSFHSPIFPNGGHVADDMWYGGNNSVRPWISGKALDQGIIERRDALLDLLVNKSKKVVAVLTGDEHNYSRTRISAETKLYDAHYEGNLTLTRTIWQITNGAAGAPYYGKEETPWKASVEKFAVQYALCLFYVDGKHIRMKVINPETLETIEEVSLK